MNLSDIGQFILLDSFIPENYPLWYTVSYPVTSHLLRLSFSRSFEASQIPYYIYARVRYENNLVDNDWIKLYPSREPILLGLSGKNRELLNLGVYMQLEFCNKITYSRYSNVESPVITVSVEQLNLNE